MNLYLQILSQDQTPDITRLLLVPAELQSGQSECHVRMSAGGRVRTHRLESIAKVVDKVRAAKLNELEVTYSIAKRGKFRLPGNAVSIIGVFTPSPTCEMWFKSEDWPVGGERAMRTRKMNAKAAETALTYYNVSRKPSIYEVAIELHTPDLQDKILDACAKWLAEFMPKPLGSLAAFGCLDAGGPEFFVKFESNVLMTQNIKMLAKLLPLAYPELGLRFDALHPVMFGSKNVCNGIGVALDKDARVIPSNSLSDFAVVRLRAGCEAQAATHRASSWLLASATGPTGVPPRGE